MNPLILVVDDEPDVEALFRQQFRRDLRTSRFSMDFARSGMQALDLVLHFLFDVGSLADFVSDMNVHESLGDR